MSETFIIGPPRSGTTLLKDLLAAHPALTVHGEDFHRFHHDLTRFRERTERADHYHLTTAEASPALVAEYREAIAAERAKSGCEHFLLKISTLSIQVDYVKALFPDARFIQLVRDGRDTACSMEDLRRALTARGDQRLLGPAPDPLGLWCAAHFDDPLVRAAASWAYHVAHSWLDLRFAGGQAFRRYRYEDLVADPRGLLEEVQRFIGVEPAPEVEVLAGEVRDAPGKEGGVGFSTIQARGPRRVGRYLEEMPAAVRAVISPLLELPMRLLGYEPDPWPEVESFFAACAELGIDPALWRDEVKAEAAWFSTHQEAFHPENVAREVDFTDPSLQPLLVDGAWVGSQRSVTRGGSTNAVSWVHKQDRRHSFEDPDGWWLRLAPELDGTRSLADLTVRFGLPEDVGSRLQRLHGLGFLAVV